VSRSAWIVIGVIGWSLVCVAFSVVLAQPTVLCPAALPLNPLDPQDPIAVCQRQMATQDTTAMANADFALFALWIGGLLAAALLGRISSRTRPADPA